MYRSRLIIRVAVALLATVPLSANAAEETPVQAAGGAQALDAGGNTRPVTPAATATRIPEPDTIALFLMGSAGLLIGRRLSRSRRRRTPDA